MGVTILTTFLGRRYGRVRACALPLALTIILANCGGSTNRGSNGEPAPTATLAASPTQVVSGQNITLTWTSTNADSGTINQGVGQVGLNGNTVLSPGVAGYPTGASTTYTYTVNGPGGTATATAAVSLGPVAAFDGMVESQGTQPQDVDPNGATGMTQYLEYVNSSLQAYSKSSPYTAVWPTPIPIQNLWSQNPPCNVSSTGSPYIQLDAVVGYDRMAQRWVVAAHTTDNNPNVGFYLCLAVSSGDDLTSATWAGYSFPIGPPHGTLIPTGIQPDWPKLGIWPNGYYIAFDEINIAANEEEGVAVCAFDRPDILNKPSSIQPAICTSIPTNGLDLGHSIIPADFDGTAPPPADRDEFMVSIQNPPDPTGVQNPVMTSTLLNLWDFQLDWTSGSLTVVQQQITVPTYTPGCYLYDIGPPPNPTVTNCVLEPNDPSNPNDQEVIDSVGDRLMPRFDYRNFGNYESYLVSHTVQTGPGATGTNPSAFQTGVRWYEFRYSGSPNNTLALNQSGTINPDNLLFRFLPSIAQNKNGDVAAGYSVSSKQNNPGIDFSYWNLTNQTAPTEVGILDGNMQGEELSPANNGVGKWGSYSSMTVDPADDCTFWYVNEYYGLADSWKTRIASIVLPDCVPKSQ